MQYPSATLPELVQSTLDPNANLPELVIPDGLISTTGYDEVYGGVEEKVGSAARLEKQRRRKWIQIGLVGILVVAAIVGGAVGGVMARRKSSQPGHDGMITPKGPRDCGGSGGGGGRVTDRILGR